MEFAEAQEYLLSLGFELSVKKFGLENSLALLEALNDPQKNYPKIQVAGTNGKGSTCAFMESILLAAGYKVGLNTSPHLISITERIRINGAEISEERFAYYATIVRRKGEELVAQRHLKALPTYFEHVTAIALLAFADAKVDIAILETGLGGRFDATTAARAEIAVLTPIDLDHTNILGPTIEKIASEKAAIIRSDAAVVISRQMNEAMAVIRTKCAAEGLEPVYSDSISADLKDGKVSFKSPIGTYTDIRLGLKGIHQIENARTAIAAANLLEARGFKIGPSSIRKGLESAVHRGRLEYFDGILFDGAHNESGARALREHLDENIEVPITMIFASMTGKDLEKISRELFTRAEKIVFVRPENPRAMETRELKGFLPDEFDRKNAFEAESVPDALRIAQEVVGGGLILVTGSLYLVGESQAHLSKKVAAVRNRP